MADKNILHMLTPTKHTSPFDVNMALDAGYDAVLTYNNVTLDDVTGLVLRCDIYRPVAEGKYPVIMTHGPYGKWLHFEDLYTDQWQRMCADQPDVPTGSA